MNEHDFTKEDLLTLKDAIQIYLRTPSPIEAEQLRDKLKSMIANYCEHGWVVFLQHPNHEPFIDKCMECNSLRFSNE